MTAFLGRPLTPPISTFYRKKTKTVMKLDALKREKMDNILQLQKFVADLHSIVKNALAKNRKQKRESASKGCLPNFVEGDFVLVAREDFSAVEKLALRWRGLRRITKALSDYVFQVEGLRW